MEALNDAIEGADEFRKMMGTLLDKIPARTPQTSDVLTAEQRLQAKILEVTSVERKP